MDYANSIKSLYQQILLCELDLLNSISIHLRLQRFYVLHCQTYYYCP